MMMSIFVQTLTALIAVGAVVVSWRNSTRAIRASDRASKLQRVVEASAEMQNQVGELRAEILPFWRDDKTRAEHAQISQEVKVHRAMEQISILHRLVDVHVMIAAQNEEQSTPLTTAASALADATMTLYLVLVPPEEKREQKPKECFARKAIRHSVPAEDAHEIVAQVERELDSSESNKDNANFADKLVQVCTSDFGQKLAKYVGDQPRDDANRRGSRPA